MLIIVFGLPGSGKSYFARHLAQKTGAIYLSSDALRRKLFQHPSYSPEEKEMVYEELLNRANKGLIQKENVVIDATFHQSARRQKVEELAAKMKVKTHWIKVYADEETLKNRLSQPRPDSDADWMIYQKIKAAFEPLEAEHIELQSTDNNLEEMLDKALKYLHK